MKVFVEEQKFKRWILVSVMSLPIVGGIVPLILSKNDIPEFNSDGFWGVTIAIISILIVLLVMLSVKLHTKINELGIYYRFFPNHFNEKFISWDTIDKCSLKKYKSYKKFGHYGYKRCFFGKNKGIRMYLGGDYRIQIALKNGKKIAIGTQKKTDVERILYTYKFKLTTHDKR